MDNLICSLLFNLALEEAVKRDSRYPNTACIDSKINVSVYEDNVSLIAKMI